MHGVLRLMLLVGVLGAWLLASCGGGASAFDELRDVTGVEPGRPVLVFVYTDG